MQAQTYNSVKVHLTLDEDEARWLKAMVQNFIGDGQEPEDNARIRKAIWDGINIPESNASVGSSGDETEYGPGDCSGAKPYYRVSCGVKLSIALERRGYKQCGTCIMDNGVEGIVYRRQSSLLDRSLPSNSPQCNKNVTEREK